MRALQKLLFFIKPTEKKKLFIILGAIVTMGIIEMMGLATILPFLAIIAKPQVVETNNYLSPLYHFFSFQNPKAFMLLLGGMVFTVLVAGNAFSALSSWFILRFCYQQGKSISCELLTKYLSQPYVFFLHRHSSHLAANVLTEVDRTVVGIFINGLQALTKLVVITCILSMLILIEPLLAVMVLGVLGSAYLIIYALMRKKLSQAGRLASWMSTVRYQLLNELVGSIKELKVLGKELTFLKTFRESASQYAKAETLCQLTPLATRYLIEAVAFGGMILIALYLIATKEDISNFLPLLGLYALAGYRLMPAMQQLFTGFTSLRYHLSSLDKLYQEMQLPIVEKIGNQEEKLPFKKNLTLKNLTYIYPQAEKSALKNITMQIPRYATIGMVGTSGAGKTTLVDIILGLLEPTEGEFSIDGTLIDAKNLKAWQKNIGYVPQNIFLLDASIASNIALGVSADEIDYQAVERAARLANLHDFIINNLSEGYQTAIGERGARLSGGQRQRIGIARALYHDPELLVFDEATSALDSVTEKIIMEAIHSVSHRKTIIIIAHRLNTVKDCDEIYVLAEGKIIGQGRYQELIESNKTFQYLTSAAVSS